MIYVPDTQLIRMCFKTHNTAGLKWGSHTQILYTTGEEEEEERVEEDRGDEGKQSKQMKS